jgi:PAS domain S-box-containing protein
VTIHHGCLIVSLAFAGGIVRAAGWGGGHRLAPLVIGEVAALAALALNYLGQWAWAARLAVFGALFADAFLAAQSRDGFRSIPMLGFPGILVIAVMLLRGVDYLILSSATLLTVTALGVGEIHGWTPWVRLAHSHTNYSAVVTVDLTLVAIACIGGLLTRDARLNLARIRSTVDQLAQANRELALSEAKYRSFVELAADAIFVTGRDGTILEVSRQASALTGIARERLPGVSMTSILSPAESEGSPFPLDLLAQGVPVMRRCRIGRPDGTAVEAEIHSAMLPEGAILCLCRDITERQQAEEERKRLQAQLLQAQKLESIGRLAGGVAHDFNNLLTLINGYSRLLLDDMFPGDPNRSGLEEIHKAGEHAAELTQRLLAFSRKQMLQPRVFDLNRVVTGMRSILTRVLGEDLELCVELCAEALTIRADPHQLEQVVMNLAVNARDAMAGGGRLRLETSCVECDESYARFHPGARPGRFAMLAVTDTGTGMDEETRRHLFEPFYTTKEVGKGTGLGLAMVLGIVEQSGGFIEVSSELGRGTGFRIHLPMVKDKAADAEPPAAVAIAASRGTETVMVVEDQADVRKFAAGALRSYGYRVLQAENAFEAKLICESGLEGLDLVLTDVVMPGLSGYELADWLAVHWPDIKVLFISGYAGEAFTGKGTPRQDAGFIQKPFSPSQLASKVREVLGAPAGPAGAGA